MLDGRQLVPISKGVPAPPYYLVATQTCSLYNESLERVPLVELIEAWPIPAGELKPKCRKGYDPREHHLEISNGEEDPIRLRLHVHQRRWIDRARLAAFPPMHHRILDPEVVDSTGKELFAKWLGSSYTRVELPDQFNDALAQSKIAEFLEQRIAKQGDKIFGIYFRIQALEDEEDNDLTADQIAQLMAPYKVILTLVVYLDDDVEDIQEEAKKLFAPVIPDPGKKDQKPQPKISQAELAVRFGLTLTDVDVVTTREWKVDDLIHNIRYTLFDTLSSSETHDE